MRLAVFLFSTIVVAAPSRPSLPTWFEAAADGQIYSRGTSGTLFLEGGAADLRLPRDGSHVRLTLVGARAGLKAEGVGLLSATTQRFFGQQRDKWVMGVPHYGRAAYRNVYPGIDMVFYAQVNDIEYDLVVKPGADPSLIRLHFEGAQNLRIDADGALLMDAGSKTLRHAAPQVYQEIGGTRRTVEGRYRLLAGGKVRFELGDYDKSQTLVIDPVMNYAGYFGSDREDIITAAAAASDGSIWITGSTYGSITIPDGQQTPLFDVNQGSRDIFVARIEPGVAGGPGTLRYYAFIGGTADEQAEAMLVDKYGALIVAGWTLSSDIPYAGKAVLTTLTDAEDAYVFRLETQWAGSDSLTFATYFAGTSGQTPANRDFAYAVGVRPNGNILIAGTTTSGVLPTALTAPAQASSQGGWDTFLAEFNPFGDSATTTMVYDSFLGGSGSDIANALVVAPSGLVFIAGETTSNNFPVNGASVQDSSPGYGDAFLAAIDTSVGGLDGFVYGSYIGGSGLDAATAMVMDDNGKLWITGYTFSMDFPKAQPALTAGGNGDIFLVEVDYKKARLDGLLASKVTGGASSDVPLAMVLTGPNTAAVAGYTYSVNFPRKGGILPGEHSGPSADGFIAQIDVSQNGPDALVSSGTFPGSLPDVISGLAKDKQGNLLFAGYSRSTNLPVIDGSTKASPAGSYTGFVGRIAPSGQ